MSKFSNKIKNIYHSLQGISAELYYGLPYKKLKFIAVTGTDGKTTTTQMIYHILLSNQFKVAYLSTISAKINGIDYDTGFHVTTPDPLVLPKYLKKMVEANVEFVVIETTSQGLEQNRAILIPFDASVITNIKSDHLDYHKTWENYAKAKFKIIEKTKDGGVVAINQDDKKLFSWIRGKFSEAKARNKIINWFSASEAQNLKQNINGLSFDYQGQKFEVPVIGRFNLGNILAAIKITQKYLGLEKIAKALLTFKTPNGRMEVISKNGFTTIIDFAHTPNALENALSSLNEIKNPNSKIICVYGCAGQRDKARRKMGEVSAKLADITVLTAEDPRDENLKDINNEIIEFAKKENAIVIKRFSSRDEYLKTNLEELKNEIDSTSPTLFAFDENNTNSREDAIDFAIKIAQKNDIVFFTGKAHEQSLAFGSTEYEWSEHKKVEEALSRLQ
jgi:UDP-N-acetylmuramoyl-L-alanyl-D-glutamate--2,6-diaminopimelate ligase